MTMTKEAGKGAGTSTEKARENTRELKPKPTQIERIMRSPVLIDRSQDIGAVLRGFRENGMFHYAAIFRREYVVGHMPSKDASSPTLLSKLLDEGIKRIVAGKGVNIA